MDDAAGRARPHGPVTSTRPSRGAAASTVVLSTVVL